jgi:hypothetical protein
MARIRIAHLSGDQATIQNTPPLVTSSKARARDGLHPLQGERFDALRPQRLAASVIVYVEQFSAHPLERDAHELYVEAQRTNPFTKSTLSPKTAFILSPTWPARKMARLGKTIP